MTDVPYLVAINLTVRCNLNCAHCYMDATQKRVADERQLSGDELQALFCDIADRAPGTIIVLTGGEPLMHPDIEGIVTSGADAGLRMVLGTNGVLLDELRVRMLKKAGLAGVGVSLDSVCASDHDDFRGVPGAFDKSVNGIKLCKSHDLHTQIHFTVTKANYRQLTDAAGFARELGVSILNFFFLVCIGRGRSQLDLPADLYEQSLKRIAELQSSSKDLMIQSRCTPHFKRILYQNNPTSPYTRAQGYDGGGCIAATHYCRITPSGDLTPCPYIEASVGNIREESFWGLWDNAPILKELRNPSLEGRCSACEFKLLCGGCRARGFSEGDGMMAEDPSCSYVPQGGDTIRIKPLAAASEQKVAWHPDARERLNRIPLFLRSKIQTRVEEQAASRRLSIVTVELMQELKREREKQLGIKFN